MKPELWAEIRRLYNSIKLSKSAIGVRLYIDRRTVRRALAYDQCPPARCYKNPKPSKLDPFKPYLQNRLRDYPELSGAKLLIEIARMGYLGSHTILRQYVSTIRPKTNETYLRLETLPGEQAQVDWANCGTIRIGNAVRKLSAFVMVLSYSRMLYVEFTLSQCLEDFLAAHVRAFQFFNGIPKKILYDNLKTVVLSRVGPAIRFNPKFVDFAGYHLFEPVPCRSRRGNEKGKVEVGIKYIRSSLLAGYAITAWPDLQQEADRWRDQVANIRIHGTTYQRPIERWDMEKRLLQPLPPKDYDTSIFRPVRANHQAFVLFDANAYSVPWELAAKRLTLKATSSDIHIFNDQTPVASHHRSYEKHLHFEKPEHRQGLIAVRKAAQACKLYDAFQALGDPAKKYLMSLLYVERDIPSHLQKIMDLVGLYGQSEVLQALDHAVKLHASGPSYIQNILQQRGARRLSDTPLIQGAPNLPMAQTLNQGLQI